MAKLYTKNTWVDEVLAADERYDILTDAGVPVEEDAQILLATAVTQAGTAVDAARMNNIEDGIDAIDDRLDDVDGRVADIEGAWVDYSATSTITGWSSFTAKQIFYKVVGKTVFVIFNLVGTSNDTVVSFTLPLAAKTGGINLTGIMQARDNSTFGFGSFYLIAAASQVDCYNGPSSVNAWTNSGNKAARGEFFYEID